MNVLVNHCYWLVVSLLQYVPLLFLVKNNQFLFCSIVAIVEKSNVFVENSGDDGRTSS